MKYTNNKNLSPLMASMIERSMRRYSSGDSDYSTTKLIDPPKKIYLEKRHDDEIEVDVSSMIAAFFGNAMHDYLEGLAPEGSLVEKRLFAEVDGVIISGQIDIVTPECMVGDYKTCKVWAISYSETYEKWEQQLNINAWLLKNGKTRNDYFGQTLINDLLKNKGLNETAFIEYFLVNWEEANAGVKSSYPQSQQGRWECKLWPEEEQLNFIKERIIIHEETKKNLPLCSDKERWKRPDTHKLKKNGRKTSLKNESNLEDLIEWGSKKGFIRNGKPIHPHYFDFVRGDYIRCMKYCNPSKFCEQWKEECNEK